MPSSFRLRHVAIAGAAFLALSTFGPAPLAALTVAPTAAISDAQYQLAHYTGHKHRHNTRKYNRNRHRYNDAPQFSAPFGYYKPRYDNPRRKYRESRPGIYFRF